MASELPLHIKKPLWLKTPLATGEDYFAIKKGLRESKLHTVCEEAKCPNISECWNSKTATFMILGDTCTRGCRFCHIKTGNPGGIVDKEEPLHVAQSVRALKLKYVVITMVDRDDLTDGGAAHVAKVVDYVKELNPGIVVELLAGDFNENPAALHTILQAKPDVFAHNLETVQRLTPRVRDARAHYLKSLRVLKFMKTNADYNIFTKTGLMLGLGEMRDEVEATLAEARHELVDFVTMGQYMRPTHKHLSIKRWVTPEEFQEFGAVALRLGFKSAASGPLVRSSYRAREYYEAAIEKMKLAVAI